MLTSFKRVIAALTAGLAGLTATACAADTILSVAEVTYDVNLRPVCTVVRMNPEVFTAVAGVAVQPSGSGDTGACALGAAGAYGNDRITRTIYDDAGEVTEVKQAYGTPRLRSYARYTYSGNGLKTSETDANGNTTALVYDSFDRLSQVQYPSTTVGSGGVNVADYDAYGYDANGNKTSWRRRNGKTISYAYDALNRETLRTVSDGSIQPVYSGYNLAGGLAYARYGSSSGAGITNYYDGLGRLIGSTDIFNRTLWFGINAAGLRTGLQFPDSVIQGYSYDAASRLTWTGAGPVAAVGFAFNDAGDLTLIGRGTAGWTGFDYDSLHRLTAMSQNLPNDTAHSVLWLFTHNPASQIVSQDTTSTVYDYQETVAATDNRTFDGLNRDAGIAALSGGYDQNGNLANDGQRVMAYDVFNRLTSVTGAGVNLSLSYDPVGRLASYTSNGAVTQFLYDGTNLIGEYDGSGQMLRRYVHALGTDQPWVQFSGAGLTQPQYLLGNYQGSVIALADASGTVSASDIYKYGAWGEPRNAGNQESWSGSRFRYTGQTVIPEARLYYYKARVYDPVFGRFLQTDPIGTKDDLDLYAYTAGDPVNGSDPTGQITVTCTVTSGAGQDPSVTCGQPGDLRHDDVLDVHVIEKKTNCSTESNCRTFTYDRGVTRFEGFEPRNYEENLKRAVRDNTEVNPTNWGFAPLGIDSSDRNLQNIASQAGAPPPGYGNFRRLSDRELQEAARKDGYRSVEEWKTKELGLNSRSDIVKDNKGNLYAVPRQGTGKPQDLGVNIK